MAHLLVVADDLTGALDTGAQFAAHGLRTLVTWDGAPPADADVWVLDTESRDLPPQAAGQRIAELAARLLPHVPRLYKKVDSTLRGNVAAELAALLAAGAGPRVLLAPAFPAQGRTTLHGRQWVAGTPLEKTGFARPGVDCSSIPALLAAHLGPVACLELEDIRQGEQSLASRLGATAGQVLVADAVEEADLRIVARAAVLAGLDRFLAGSAGLAAHLPAAWGLEGSRAAGDERRAPGPVLFVAGTDHPCLAGQLACLAQHASPTVVTGILGGLLARGDETVAERSRAAAEALQAGADAVLTTDGEPRIAGGRRAVAALLARVAARAVEGARPAALVLTGGDVAMAVCRVLGASAIAVQGQVEPGIPLGRLVGGPQDGLPLAAKAGGFGSEDALWRILVRLRGAGVTGATNSANASATRRPKER